MPEIVDLGPHERMTTEQALACASREKWDDVIICGFREGSGDLAVMSSHMTRELSLWITEHLKLYTMGRL